MNDDQKSKQAKKEFAKAQLQFLKDRGISSKMRLSRIFKAAGPGQIKEAWELANSVDATTEEGKIKKDLLDCLITGYMGVSWGKTRMEKVLKAAGFNPPEVNNSDRFTRILEGAGEILVPGSVEFTEDQLEAIKDGIIGKKKKSEQESNKTIY